MFIYAKIDHMLYDSVKLYANVHENNHIYHPTPEKKSPLVRHHCPA